MPLAESANLRAHVFTDASKPHLPSVMPPAISNRFTKVSSLSCLRIESPASYGSLSHIHNKQQPPERTSVAFCSWRLSFRKAIRKSSFSSDNTIATSPERITQSHASIDRTRDCRATSPQPSAPIPFRFPNLFVHIRNAIRFHLPVESHRCVSEKNDTDHF